MSAGSFARFVTVPALILGIGGTAVSAAPDPAWTALCGAMTRLSVESVAVEAAVIETLDLSDFAPAYVEAHNDFVRAAATICEFPVIDVWSYEWGYDGLDGLIPETVIFNLDNSGGQMPHNLLIFEVSDEVDDDTPIRDILERSDWREYLTLRGQTPIALPGEPEALTDSVELTPGRWAAVCMVRDGTTSEVLLEALETGEAPEATGDPHWRRGQAVDFFVDG